MNDEQQLTETGIVLASLINSIAEVIHETNRAYCKVIGDVVQKPFSECSDDTKQSIFSGILYKIKNPKATPEDQHEQWCKTKIVQGWAYSETRNDELKLHNCMVPYKKLPEKQQVKDALFGSIVLTMAKQFDLI